MVNEKLMDNHQKELAGAMSSRGHLLAALPATLYDTLSDPQLYDLKPWPKSHPETFAEICDELVLPSPT